MKSAVLYIRVSTDEQADKGYSQRAQDEALRRYCELNGIVVAKVVYEDHSAKTFQRPAWRALLAWLKKVKPVTEFLLFTKWDRFSRNTGDAYQMIGLLNRLGCEPHAIEQPLDLSIPENKMMMAFYLAAPEVENDRRALNVKHGMRRAKKEGRYMGIAPVGYANKCYENGQKYIAPEEPLAGLMQWAFQQIATGRYPVEQVWRKARKNGLRCCQNNFRNIIRNPVYCGKIMVPGTKDEPEHWVEGQHQALISERLFLQVQTVLRVRTKIRTTLRAPEQLPLRGFLKCPNCHRMLTGSASKGRNGYFFYYHCQPGCKMRFKAGELNRVFFDRLSHYELRPFILSVFKNIIKEVFGAQQIEEQHLYTLALKEAETLKARLERAQELLLSGDLEGAEYRAIKSNAEKKLAAVAETLAACGGNDEKVAAIIRRYERELPRLDLYLEDKGSEAHRRALALLIGDRPMLPSACLNMQPVAPMLKLLKQIMPVVLR